MTDKPPIWKELSDRFLHRIPEISGTPALDLAVERDAPGSPIWEHRAPIQRSLLKHGANLNVTDDEGMTPLLRGYFCDDRLFVQMALAKGATVNVQDRSGRTPLMFAAAWNDAVLVQTLLACGVNVNDKCGTGGTALIDVFYDHPSPTTIKTLLAHGADVNLKDTRGTTALINALRFSPSAAIVKILLGHGAVVNVKDAYGVTPLKLAVTAKRPDLIRLLKRYGAKK
jgi:ankyrin repeat protein